MRIIVAGSRGMLAHDLIPLLEKNHQFIPVDEDQLDITHESRVLDLIGEVEPDLVINCAAYNLVDQAEEDRESAFRVNADGVRHLATACRETRSILCHFSTDYVFDGNSSRPYQPHDQPNPISVYGESKRAGEVFLQSILGERYYLIRTSSLYGRHGSNFVHTILRLAGQKQTLSVVDDQIMSPTWTVNLAQAVVALVESGHFGSYHFTDQTDGGISWFQFAEEILKIKGLKNELKPVKSGDFKRPARRPAYSVLDTALVTQRTGFKPMPWQESLKHFLNMI